MDDNQVHTDAIIDALFPGNPLLCVAKYIPGGDGATEHYTRPRSEWKDLNAWELIVPSPMTSVWGITKAGKPSQHSLANTGPRRFLINEFDKGTVDEHAAILLHLAQYAPLVCVVHSGGKSLHGWFYCAGQPEDKVERFFRYAVSLGADPALWTRSQFARLPDGIRNNGKRQTVFFLSLKPLEHEP